MSLVDALLPEFDHEMTTTRVYLERVPEDQWGWTPHAKSMSLGTLATHIATIPMWGHVTLTQPDFDVAGPSPAPATSRAEILRMFDAHVAAARVALVGKTDAELAAPWALTRGTQIIFSMPKASVWRSFVMSHLVHHRAQLGVYLRMHDIAVPATYGPSADERAF